MDQEWGKIQVFTGNGKGKTTSALGTALRAHARGKKVVFVYFDKGGEHYSEEKLLDDLGIEYHRFGRDRIDPQTGKFDFAVTKEDKKQGQLALELSRKLLDQNTIDLLVLDEANISSNLGIINQSEVLDLIKNKPDYLEVILTGRNAPQSFIEAADLVTDMKLVKHYFYQGRPAREGLDY